MQSSRKCCNVSSPFLQPYMFFQLCVYTVNFSNVSSWLYQMMTLPTRIVIYNGILQTRVKPSTLLNIVNTILINLLINWTFQGILCWWVIQKIYWLLKSIFDQNFLDCDILASNIHTLNTQLSPRHLFFFFFFFFWPRYNTDDKYYQTTIVYAYGLSLPKVWSQ